MSIFTAAWLRDPTGCESPIFRKHFIANGIKKATLDICGLGWHEAYINGRPVTDAVLAPGASTYSQVNHIKKGFYPWNGKMLGTRAYYLSHDITELLCDGDNLLSVHLGNGYWNQKKRLGEGDFTNGAPILCYSLRIELKNSEEILIESDTDTLCKKSGIIENNLYFGEVHDLSVADIHGLSFDESDMQKPEITMKPDFELCLWDFPYDKVVRSVTPVLIGEVDGKKIYDVGENIAGWIAFDTCTSSEIYMEFAENICGDKSLCFRSTGHFWEENERNQLQSCRYIGDGKPHFNVHPRFSWQGFRYFSLEGEAENLRCDIVHTDLRQTGDFVCDNKMINAILDNYKRSQLTNIHGCIPSDCPHRERLGYTGDGQITCETVMHIFDAKGFYKKWMRDVADGQDTVSGRIQNTAPFAGGGGGPSGWGGAVFVVPYTYYKMYGDDSLVREYAGNMARYFEYLEERCEDELIVRSEEGSWCLGDWCWPGCTAFSTDLSQKYVNTAYLVKYYDMILELEDEIGVGFDKEEYTARRKRHADAVVENFFDKESGNFDSGRFGANVFALEIGLGDERTFDNLVKYYDELGGFDTGIFATEFLIRILGKRGRADLVYKLLTSSKFNASFYSMYQQGATTLWEDWDGHSSHNHPMFGGCFKAMWTVFLGIQPTSAGYRSVRIAPCDIEGLGNMHGYLETACGRLSVDLARDGEGVTLTVFVPHGCKAYLKFRGQDIELYGGVNVLRF